jgi:AcrR family transcriptional regulator
MQLQAWDDSTEVTYDKQLLAELTSLRFLADAYDVLIMGPVGVGKTFLANALGHIAVRRGHSVHAERADKLFKRLKAARLDASYDEEMRRLQRVDLLVLDDFALHRLDATETSDFYELIVERHRQVSTIVTSNRSPDEMLAMMADPLLAQSAIDRLQSAAFELIVEGPPTGNGKSQPVPPAIAPDRSDEKSLVRPALANVPNPTFLAAPVYRGELRLPSSTGNLIGITGVSVSGTERPGDGARRRRAGGGRPLDSSRDAAILEAALEGLAERGYDLLTMDEIAARAHAGKGALYRRWPSKAALVADAVLAWRDQLGPVTVPDRGSLRGDIEALLDALPDFGPAEQRQLAVLFGLVTAARRDPELSELLSNLIVQRPRQAVAQMLERAAARGEIPRGRVLTLVPDLVIAMSSLRFLLGETPDREFVRRVFEELVYPLVTAPAAGPTPRSSRARRLR